MRGIIKDVDLSEGMVLITFADGTAALFDAEFLYAHRDGEGNEPLPPEQEIRRTERAPTQV